jgi:hypothetical protein
VAWGLGVQLLVGHGLEDFLLDADGGGKDPARTLCPEITVLPPDPEAAGCVKRSDTHAAGA